MKKKHSDQSTDRVQDSKKESPGSKRLPIKEVDMNTPVRKNLVSEAELAKARETALNSPNIPEQIGAMTIALLGIRDEINLFSSHQAKLGSIFSNNVTKGLQATVGTLEKIAQESMIQRVIGMGGEFDPATGQLSMPLPADKDARKSEQSHGHYL